jgi:hypothetical protein
MSNSNSIRPGRVASRIFALILYILCIVLSLASSRNFYDKQNAAARAGEPSETLELLAVIPKVNPLVKNGTVAITAESNVAPLANADGIELASIAASTLTDGCFIPNHPSQTNLSKVEGAVVLDNTNKDEVSPLASCNPTAQVRVAFSAPQWTLTTYDNYGRMKYVGGDEFYIMYFRNNVTVEDLSFDKEPPPHPTAIAFCHDHGDGNYTLDFVTTPMNPNVVLESATKTGGSLAVHFDYTCNIGMVPQPLKKLWKTRGSTKAVHAIRVAKQPPIRVFQLPPKPAAIQNMSSFKKVNLVGASTMRNVAQNRTGGMFENNTRYHAFRHPLNTTTMEHFVLSLVSLGHSRNSDVDVADETAIVMGSDAWDILKAETFDPYFEDHLMACTTLVETARKLYPNATLVWK